MALWCHYKITNGHYLELSNGGTPGRAGGSEKHTNYNKIWLLHQSVKCRKVMDRYWKEVIQVSPWKNDIKF